MSTTSHATSRPKTTKMKSLKVETSGHFHVIISSSREEVHSGHGPLSPFDPSVMPLEDSDHRFERSADFLSQVGTRNFVGHSSNGHTCQDHEGQGPLEVQHTGCDEVGNIACRTQEGACPSRRSL